MAKLSRREALANRQADPSALFLNIPAHKKTQEKRKILPNIHEERTGYPSWKSIPIKKASWWTSGSHTRTSPARMYKSACKIYTAGSQRKNIPWRCSIPGRRIWRKRPAPCFAITAAAPPSEPSSGRRPESGRPPDETCKAFQNCPAIPVAFFLFAINIKKYNICRKTGRRIH